MDRATKKYKKDLVTLNGVVPGMGKLKAELAEHVSAYLLESAKLEARMEQAVLKVLNKSVNVPKTTTTKRVLEFNDSVNLDLSKRKPKKGNNKNDSPYILDRDALIANSKKSALAAAFDQKWWRLLPMSAAQLQNHLWLIDVNDYDIPLTVMQVLKLGLDFIPKPASHLQKLQLERCLEKEIEPRWTHDHMSDKHLLNIIKASGQFLQGAYLAMETDKNMGVCLITKAKYEQMVKDTIVNDQTFQQKDCTVESIVLEFNRQLQLIDSRLGRLIKGVKKELPMFRGLPKVHKTPVKLRPVVDARDVYSTKVGILLVDILQPLVREMNKVCVFNTMKADDFIARLKKVQEDIEPKQLGIYAEDVKSLYPSIDQELLFEHMAWALDSFRMDTNIYTDLDLKDGFCLSNAQVNRLVKLYVVHNFIIAKIDGMDHIYKQVQGIPTGGNPCTFLAMIFLMGFEIPFMTKFPDLAKQYKHSARYLDDWLILTTDKDYSTGNFQRLVYQDKLTLESPIEFLDSTNTKSFLDLTVRIDRAANEINWSIYRKKGNAYMYPHFKTFLPKHVKTGFIYGELLRIKRRCKTEDSIASESALFFKCLGRRGYHIDFIMDAASKTADQKHVDFSRKWLVVPFNSIVKPKDILDLVGGDYQLSYRNNTSLKSLLSHL